MGCADPVSLTATFFDRDVEAVARDLIGAELTVASVGGIIVEVEAYDDQDPASHSYVGPTLRNAIMFGPSGHAYVYRIYGLHWCLNVVTGPVGSGSAVLIRALQPTKGVDAMVTRRGVSECRKLCAGPGRLTQALAIDFSHNGAPLFEAPFSLSLHAMKAELVAGPRIGISKAIDLHRRFAAKGSAYLSRPLGLL